MKALLIKDYLNIKELYKSNLLVILVFMGIGVATKNIFYTTTMLIILGMNLTITTMTFDEKTNWNQYSIAMPIKRNSLVKEKYLFALINIVGATIIAFLVSYFGIYLRTEMDILELISAIAGVLLVVLIMLSIIIPIAFKYGVEKTRIAMMAVFLVPTILVLLIAKFVPKPENIDIELLFKLGFALITFLSIVGFLLSMFISKKIVENKDY